MAIQIQIRRDTAINWTNTNPVLAQGEMGLDLNTKLFKTGDGVTAWNDLDYNPPNYPDYLPSTGPILFDAPMGRPRSYGDDTPVTGNITFGTAGAITTVMPKMRHNDSVEPTFTAPGGVALIKEGGTYQVNVDNYILAICEKNTSGAVVRIRYTISKNEA